MIAAVGIVAGVAVLSWNQNATRLNRAGWSLLWPLAGAVVRGLAQAGAKAGLLLWPNPFAAGLIGYVVSSATVLTADRIGRGARGHASKAGIAWFAATGALNGCALLLMYSALNQAPVALVAPVIATYPLVTALVSAVCLRDEKLTVRMLAGAALIVAAIVYLVAAGAA
jgi:drug/metabolite transporter (DMT)-like permease